MEETIGTNKDKGIIASQRAVFSILLVNFIGTLSYSIILPFMVVIVLKLGGNEIVYGILGATYSFFQFIAAPVLGAWSDKVGRKKILLLSSAGTLAGWLIFIIALLLPDKKISFTFCYSAIIISVPLMTIFFARAIDGITGGNISVANAYLADISTRQERKRNFGKMAASANLGLIVGPMLAGILGATFLGNILPVVAAALISLLAIIIIFFKLKEVIPQPVKGVLETGNTGKILGHGQRDCYHTTTASDEKRLSVFKLPNVPYFITLYFLIFLAFNFYYVSFPVFAAQQLHWTVLQLGVFFSFLSGVLVLIQGPVLTWLTTKFASAYLVIAGGVVLSVSFIFFRSENVVLLYSGSLFFAVGNGLMWPSFLTIMSNIVSDKNQGVMQGYASSAGSLASIIGLLSGALLYKKFGVNIFLITAFLILIISFVSYPMIAIEKKNNNE